MKTNEMPRQDAQRPSILASSAGTPGLVGPWAATLGYFLCQYVTEFLQGTQAAI